jgi:hypothetical protein
MHRLVVFSYSSVFFGQLLLMVLAIDRAENRTRGVAN